MEHDYGQVRQDIGELKIILKNTEIMMHSHAENDEKMFAQIETRLTWLEKMMWFALGGVAVIGLSGIAELMRSFLIR